jgi:hypothetical protein
VAFETGTATSVNDFFQKLSTFAQANGWTEDHSDYVTNRRLSIHRNNTFVQFNWDPAASANVGIYQSTAFTGAGTAPGNHTGDSGQGVVSNTNATIATGRFVALVNTTMTYWFFEDDFYLHCVAETSAGVAVHFGMGLLDKFGDNWTGGDYAYGHKNGASGSASNSAIQADASYLLDALCTSNAFMASLKMTGIPSQAVGTWGIVGAVTSPGTDRGGTARSKVYGGYRGNGLARSIGRIGSSNAQGLVAMYPIGVLAQTSTSDLYFLGTLPDVRGINIQSFALGDTIVIGGDDWLVFPSRVKGEFNSTSTSKYQGIAYKKVP